MDIPQAQESNNAFVAGSPEGHHRFLLPSPIPTRRSRTLSMSERAKKSGIFRGTVKEFCRQKGHGFIIPADKDAEEKSLFVHISDIEEDYVPKPGDKVEYNRCLIPPQNTKHQAVHVKFVELNKDQKHEKWDSPASSPQL